MPFPAKSTLILDQGSFPHDFIHEFLPDFAAFAGFMAVIWLACAVITLAGGWIGGAVFLGLRWLIRVFAARLHRLRDAEYARLVIVHPDGVSNKVINLNAYRRRRQPEPPPNPPAEGEEGPDGEPA